MITQEFAAPLSQRDPTDAEVQAASERLAELEAEARALGNTAAAAQVHWAMGRLYAEELGDIRSAAICHQNAFVLDPAYRPNLESARRLFAGAGKHDKALALHRREAALLDEAGARADSLLAQVEMLQRLGRTAEARQLLEEALALAPDHLRLLDAAARAAEHDGDRPAAAGLLLRAAAAASDPIWQAQHLRRAVVLEAPASAVAPDVQGDDALARLHQADPADPLAFLGIVERARAGNDWETVVRLCRERAERTGSAADRAVVAAVLAWRLGRVQEGLAEVTAALERHRDDRALLSLRGELAERQESADLPAILRQRAQAATEPGERAHLEVSAALLLQDPMEKEQLLGEALSHDPGDAAAIAQHARLLAQRDPAGAGDRFLALGESVQGHAPREAAAHYLEAALWHERAGNREGAASLAQRALALVPWDPAAVRVLTRTLPPLGRAQELAEALEQAAPHLPRGAGAEALARAATLLADSAGDRAAALAERAAGMARGLSSPRWLETWSTLAFRAGNFGQLSQALEARAESSSGADAADLLVEASELSRAAGDEARAAALLRKARGMEPASAAARTALLSLASLPASERIDLLGDEARQATPERAAGLHAERAALLEAEGRADEAVQACAQALAIAGVDLAVLRRLARLQLGRGDHAAALAVLVRIAEALPEAQARADAYLRAADVAEWQVGDMKRAAELVRFAAEAQPESPFARAQLARLLAWTGSPVEAAGACEELARISPEPAERNEARRTAASLYAHRGGQPEKAASLLRALLSDLPGDVGAASELVALLGDAADARKERAELRSQLASRCGDPRPAALFWAESAGDLLAGGDRDGAVAAWRRAVALDPQDRSSQDGLEQALRAAGKRSELAEHLALRCSSADAQTRAALSLERAQILAGLGRMDEASAAYGEALASDPDSLLALRGLRRIAETRGDREEVMRLLSREAALAHDAGAMVEAALLVEHLGSSNDEVERLAAALHADPGDREAAGRLRGMLGDDAPRALSAIYEKVGHAHADDKAGAAAWTQAASLELQELNDAPAAFFAAGRALSRDPQNVAALELRADAAEAADRRAEAAEALQKLLELLPGDARAAGWTPRLGRLYADLGEPGKALALLAPTLDALPAGLLLQLAPGAQSLAPEDGVRVYRRLLEVFPAAGNPAPTDAQLAEWSSAAAARHLSLGQRDEALQAYRRVLRHDPHDAAALRAMSESGSPGEAISAQRAWLRLSSAPEPLHALVKLFLAGQQGDAAFCAAATLSALGLDTPDERAIYEAESKKPPPLELPLLADGAPLRAEGDEGPARELLQAAAAELATALPTGMGAGRGALVKGDNPVRRVVAALARSLGIPEPQIFLARGEPGIVAPVAGERAGLLVGAEVPRRFSPRQQRFLYARALAHVRRGTHMLAALSAPRLATMTGELIRLAAPHGTDFSQLPRGDAALAETLARHVGPEARARLAEPAARAAAAETDWEALALGIRESAERAGLLVCADPAAALGIVSAEAQGGLEKPEVSRLARFAVSDAFLEARCR
ncbi:MAG TPA: hypothetical protein VFL36_03565 [Myxococcales bacterium]|nr:hypothetical protein [Myxococcales bacterium]